MDASEYRARTNSPDAMRVGTLEDILRIVQAQDSGLAAQVTANLHVVTIETPEQHDGEPGWVQLALPEQLAESVLDCLSFAEAGAVGPDGETTQEASCIAGLVDAWLRWRDRDET